VPQKIPVSNILRIEQIPAVQEIAAAWVAIKFLLRTYNIYLIVMLRVSPTEGRYIVVLRSTDEHHCGCVPTRAGKTCQLP